MLDQADDLETKPKGTPIFTVWEKYEDVAMHFNDLLIKLRIQALAGVTVLAVLASIVSNVKTYNFQGTWVIAAAVFGALLVVWVAIWALDMLYYNRLLIGSVVAIIDLEKQSIDRKYVSKLELSAIIEQSVWNKLPAPLPLRSRWYLLRGVIVFYSLVFLVLVAGFVGSLATAWPNSSLAGFLRSWLSVFVS